MYIDLIFMIVVVIILLIVPVYMVNGMLSISYNRKSNLFKENLLSCIPIYNYSFGVMHMFGNNLSLVSLLQMTLIIELILKKIAIKNLFSVNIQAGLSIAIISTVTLIYISKSILVCRVIGETKYVKTGRRILYTVFNPVGQLMIGTVIPKEELYYERRDKLRGGIL